MDKSADSVANEVTNLSAVCDHALGITSYGELWLASAGALPSYEAYAVEFAFCPFCGVQVVQRTTLTYSTLPIAIRDSDVNVILEGAHTWDTANGTAITVHGDNARVYAAHPLRYRAQVDEALFAIYGSHSSIDIHTEQIAHE